MNALKALQDHGQAVWLDFLSRGFIAKGGLKKLVEDDGLRGVTSNPSIFEHAIGQTNEYDDAVTQILKQHDRPAGGVDGPDARSGRGTASMAAVRTERGRELRAAHRTLAMRLASAIAARAGVIGAARPAQEFRRRSLDCVGNLYPDEQTARRRAGTLGVSRTKREVVPFRGSAAESDGTRRLSATAPRRRSAAACRC